MKGSGFIKDRALFYRALRFVFKPLFLLLFQPKIICRDRIPSEGAAVIAGNHKHALDPILVDVCTKRVVRTLAKKDLHDGAFGFVFKGVRAIPVDLHARSNPDALNEAVKALREGYAVNVSPEAKRNYTDELLLPFKYGAVSMAQKTGAPIIPYVITGEYKPFGGLTIRFGEPIYVGDNLTEANERLYNVVYEMFQITAPKDFLEKKHFTPFSSSEHKK